MSWVSQRDSFFRATGQVFYERDPANGKMTFFGDVERLLGCSAVELPGSWAEWLHQIYPKEEISRIIELDTANGKAERHRLEYRFCRKDGSAIYLRDTCTRMRDEKTQQTMFIGSMVDITDQRNLLAQLQHLQKKQVLGELAGGVAHDFNNLLTIFNGYTEILQEECSPEAPQREFLEEMANAVERANVLTTRILNFTRTTKNPVGVIQASSVILELCRMLGRIVPKNIEWATGIEEACGWIAADHRQIEAILINIVLNACDAMPKGGRLGVELAKSVIRPTDRRVAASGWKAGSYVQITVSDTGSGMEPTVQARIFEPFFTTKSQRGASGLGLSISANIVEQLGGKITVESIPNEGSVFHVFIPRVEPPALENGLKGKNTDRSIAWGKGESILVVEDDHAVQKALAATLKRLKYKVLCAFNGEEALRIIAQNGDIRLVLSDLVMPLMGGIELAKNIRKGLPDLKLVLTSGYAQPPEEPTTQDTYDIFLPKPLSFPVLASKLRQLLDA